MSIYDQIERLVNTGTKATTILQRLRKGKNFAKPLAKAVGYGFAPEAIVNKILEMGGSQVRMGTTPEISADIAEEERRERGMRTGAKIATGALAATQIPRAVSGVKSLGTLARQAAKQVGSIAPTLAPQAPVASPQAPVAPPQTVAQALQAAQAVQTAPQAATPAALAPMSSVLQQAAPAPTPQAVQAPPQAPVAQALQAAPTPSTPTPEATQTPEEEPEADTAKLDSYVIKQLKSGKTPPTIFALLSRAKAFKDLLAKAGGTSYYNRILELKKGMRPAQKGSSFLDKIYERQSQESATAANSLQEAIRNAKRFM